MNNLHIAPTESTPEIHFDGTSGVLEIRGESYPENTAAFYAPVLDWVREYIDTTNTPTRLDIKILYFNSSSSKALMNLFDLLDAAAAKGKQVAINWHYESGNDSALEYGEEFKEDLDSVQFNLIENND